MALLFTSLVEGRMLTIKSSNALRTAICLALVCGASACSTAGNMLAISEVKPWERGTLARDDMQIVNDALEQSVDEHIYFSKEASTGGMSVQGGGCGCN